MRPLRFRLFAILAMGAVVISAPISSNGFPPTTPKFMAYLKGGKQRPVVAYRAEGDFYLIDWAEGGNARLLKSMIERFEPLGEEQAARILRELQSAPPPREPASKPPGKSSASSQTPRLEPARRYEDGPLKPVDFAAPPPTGVLATQAYTFTSIRYGYHYRRVNLPRGIQVIATQLSAAATVSPDKSWNRAPNDLRLLDHEQGHFDITQIHTVRFRKRFAELVRQGALTGIGPTEALAYDQLNAKVRAEFQAITKDWQDEQARYDAETNAGRDPMTQAEWRQRLNTGLNGGQLAEALKQ